MELRLQTQNSIMQNKRGYIPSVFGNEECATTAQIGEFTQQLACMFECTGAFLTMVAKIIKRDCISAKRLQYILRELENHPYHKLTIADVFKHDKEMELITYNELVSEYDEVPVANIQVGGKHFKITIENAEKYGIAYRRGMLKNDRWVDLD